VGLACAKDLAARGATVYLTGRNQQRTDAAASSLPAAGHEAHRGFALDLTDLDSVQAFTSQLIDSMGVRGLDAMILNAGMFYDATTTGPATVTMGMSKQDRLIAANHLGHFKLLTLLLDLLTAWGTRVVFTSSISHHLGTAAGVLPGQAAWEEGIVPGGETVSFIAAFRLYGNSKLMNVLTAKKLQRLFDDESNPTTASVVVSTPGFVASNIGSDDRSPTRFNPLDYLPLARSSADGGRVLAFAVTVEHTLARDKMLQPYWIWEEGARFFFKNSVWRGCFFNFVQEMLLQRLTPAGTIYAFATSDPSHDEHLQDQLWAWSLEATKEK